MKIPVPITRRGNESEIAFMTRLMLSLYGRPVQMVHPVRADGYRRKVKKVKLQ